VARRKFREERSKFHGTKQVLQDLNIPAHATLHDLDVSLPGSSASGYVLFWNSATFIHSNDISPPIYAPEDGTIDVVYASLPDVAVADIEFDVYLNGSTIFTAPGTRPKILTGNTFSADAIPVVTDVTARDAFEVQILDAGGNYGRAMVYIVIK